MSSFVCFHIAQNIRLNRFFKERRIQLQSEQMSDVLNSQSDAILAFEKVDQNSSGPLKPLNILFSNLKAFMLFSYDFSSRRDMCVDCEQPASESANNPLQQKIFSPIKSTSSVRTTTESSVYITLQEILTIS